MYSKVFFIYFYHLHLSFHVSIYFIVIYFSIFFLEIAGIVRTLRQEKKKIPDLGPGPDQIPDLVLGPKAKETKGKQDKRNEKRNIYRYE